MNVYLVVSPDRIGRGGDKRKVVYFCGVRRMEMVWEEEAGKERERKRVSWVEWY
jgi:hypothetical protein